MSNSAAPEPVSVAPAPPSRPKPRRLRAAIRLGLLLAIGFLAGTVAKQFGQPTPDASVGADEIPPPAKPKEHRDDTAKILERIDTAIRGGQYAVGLEVCQTLPASADARSVRRIRYREGLCLEGLSKHSEAAKAYYASCESDDVGAWARATLGRVRTLRDSPSEARSLLSEVFLRSGHPLCRDQRIMAECLHLHARLLVRELSPPTDPDPFDASVLAWANLDIGLFDYLDWLPEPVESRHPEDKQFVAADARPPHTSSFRVAPHPKARDILRATGESRDVLALDALRTIGRAAGLAVTVDPAAMGMLSGRLVTLEVSDIPFTVLLNCLTHPQGLGWRIRADTLDIRPEPGTRPASPKAAIESLRLALRIAHGHPSQAAEEVALGNLLQMEGQNREATAEYRRLLEDRRHAPEAAFAAMSLGLYELRTGEFRSARARFIEVIDRKPHPKWVDAASWWIARTYLDAGEFEPAMRHLVTAGNGSTRPVALAGTLGLCATHLLRGDESAARAVRAGFRTAGDRDAVAAANWLDAIFRYRVYPTTIRADALAAATGDAREGKFLGPAGALLAGRLYREMGRHDEMIRVYDFAAPTTRGAMATEMTFAVADRLDRTDRRDAARIRFLAIAAAETGSTSLTAELRLASIALDKGRAEECIGRSRWILGRPEADRVSALRLMGRGYELTGDYRKAAECFAGRVPDE